MKSMSYAIIIAASLLARSCTNQSADHDVSHTDSSATIMAGQKLTTQLCGACHNPNVAEADLLAPTLAEIKAVYMQHYPSRDSFVRGIIAFVNAPSAAMSKMPEGVSRHGVMPYQQYQPDDIMDIARYLYDYQQVIPDWLPAYYLKKYGVAYQQSGASIPESALTVEGRYLQYANQTKQLLGTNLQQQIKKNGTAGALSFCNVQALPLTDSMARKYQTTIRRVTDRPRNPTNQANAQALKVLSDYQQQMAQGAHLDPVIVGGYFYFPIITNTMCMQCHGTVNKDIQPDIYKQILKLYPEDKAVGYSPNELRGIWSIKIKE